MTAYSCAGAGRLALDFHNLHLDGRDDVCAAACKAAAACPNASTHTAAITNAPRHSATRARKLSDARAAARMAAPAFPIDPAHTAAVATTPPRPVAHWTPFSSAYISACTAAAFCTDKPAANPFTVGARRHVRCFHSVATGRDVR